MGVRIVLGIFGGLYVLLAVWCWLAPRTVARNVGFELIGGSGRSEFAVVYGGLELAMGAFFLLGAWKPEHAPSALLFALVSSACLAITRLVTVIRFPGIEATTWGLFATEVLLTIIAAVTWFAARPD